MSLYRRKSIWWVRFTTPTGKRVRRSTGTADKKQAQEFHDRLKAQIWQVQKLGEKPRRKWEEAVVRWLKIKAHKASIVDDKMHLRWMDRHLRDKYLDEINRDFIDSLVEARLQEGVSNATVNRLLQILRSILRMAAREWEWLGRYPAIRLLPEPKRRVRWLTREEADRLISELPEHLAEMARFSLATGLRQRNVADLEWAQVDMERRVAWIHADQAKARRAIAVPLNAEAMLVLRRQHGQHPNRVFVYRGKPIRQVNTKAWKAALKRGRHRELPLARSAPHLGLVARAIRDTAARVAGARRMGNSGDGAAICASRLRPSGGACGANRPTARDERVTTGGDQGGRAPVKKSGSGKCPGHKSGTTHWFLWHTGEVNR